MYHWEYADQNSTGRSGNRKQTPSHFETERLLHMHGSSPKVAFSDCPFGIPEILQNKKSGLHYAILQVYLVTGI